MKYHHAAAILFATATATSLGSDSDPHDLIEPIMYGYCIGCTAAIMTHTVVDDDNGTTECTVPPIMSTESPMIKYTPSSSSSRCSSSEGGLDHATSESSSKQLFLQLQHTPPPPCASSGKQPYHLNQNPTEHHQPSLFSLCEVNLLRLSRAIHTTANNEDSRNNNYNSINSNEQQKQTFLQQNILLTQSLVLLLAVAAVGLAWRWGASTTTKHKNETCRETTASCALVEKQPQQHNKFDNKFDNKQYKLGNKLGNEQRNKQANVQDNKQHNEQDAKFDNKQHNKFDLISRRLVNDDFGFGIGLIATVEEEEEDDDLQEQQQQQEEIEATVVKDVVQEEEETTLENDATTTTAARKNDGASATPTTTNDCASATPAATTNGTTPPPSTINTPEPQWTLRYKGEWEPPFHPTTTTNDDGTITTIAEEVIILTKPIVRRNTTSVRMNTTAAAANNNANKHVKSILTSKSCESVGCNVECMTELKVKKRVSFQSDVMQQDRKEEEVASLSCSRAKNKKRGLFWLKQLSLGNLCMR